MIESESTE